MVSCLSEVATKHTSCAVRARTTCLWSSDAAQQGAEGAHSSLRWRRVLCTRTSLSERTRTHRVPAGFYCSVQSLESLLQQLQRATCLHDSSRAVEGQGSTARRVSLATRAGPRSGQDSEWQRQRSGLMLLRASKQDWEEYSAGSCVHVRPMLSHSRAVTASDRNRILYQIEAQ